MQAEFEKEYMAALDAFLEREAQQELLFPPRQQIFNAFHFCPFDAVKVVLLGQDPYHGIGQAHGLSFSVPDGIKIPPSLSNIFKELKSDIGMALPNSGNLSAWAQQGVLLLNATLTVRAHQAGSHQKKGWETFTDAVIKKISDEKNKVVFLLWGRYAKQKKEWIDEKKHLVLEAAHPSPLARGAFFGCRHFSKTNAYLIQHQKNPIEWGKKTEEF